MGLRILTVEEGVAARPKPPAALEAQEANLSRAISLPVSRLFVLLHKCQRNVEDYGWWVALKKIAAYLSCPVYFHQVYRLYRLNLREKQPHQAWLPNGFCFKLVRPSDACAIAQIEEVAEWLRGRLQAQLEAGKLCLACFRGEAVVAFNLVAFGRVFMPLIRLQRRLRPGIAWSEHIAVGREFRKMGLASQLRYRLFDELRKRGYHQFYAGALASNVASARMQMAVGLRPFVDVHYRRLLFLQAWQYKKVRAESI